MDILVEMAIDLACQLQEDERYLKLAAAQQDADNDAQLQDLIGQFNLKRMAINQEETKPDDERDADKLRQLNKELQEVYASIMSRPTMNAYNDAKEELDALVGRINAAIALAVQGQDPHRAGEDNACTGDCSSCGGCH